MAMIFFVGYFANYFFGTRQGIRQGDGWGVLFGFLFMYVPMILSILMIVGLSDKYKINWIYRVSTILAIISGSFLLICRVHPAVIYIVIIWCILVSIFTMFLFFMLISELVGRRLTDTE